MVLGSYPDPANSTSKYSDLVSRKKCLPGRSLVGISNTYFRIKVLKFIIGPDTIAILYKKYKTLIQSYGVYIQCYKLSEIKCCVIIRCSAKRTCGCLLSIIRT